MTNAAVAVVDEDRSALSRELIEGLRAPFFQPPVGIGLNAMDRDMDAGHYTFVLDIPPQFQADILDVTVCRPVVAETTALGAAYLAALGREPVAYDRSIDMHVSNLRRKLGPAADGSDRVETIRGIGYQYRGGDA